METLIDINISAGIKVTKLTRNRPPSWNCVSATESYIAAGTVEDKMVILWSAQTCEVVAALPGHTSYIINMDFSEVVASFMLSYLLAYTQDLSVPVNVTIGLAWPCGKGKWVVGAKGYL